jgi:hypothetical protein
MAEYDTDKSGDISKGEAEKMEKSRKAYFKVEFKQEEFEKLFESLDECVKDSKKPL